MQETYRAAVGPANNYDLIGGQQFVVLYNLGLREHHKLCDVGCGSLRAGRLFIPYLAEGNYYGIEPQSHLVSLGLQNEVGLGILQVKQPSFIYRDDFLLSDFDQQFDFILAQSIFSHTAKWQIEQCLEQVHKTLRGKFVFTYFKGQQDYKGKAWTRNPSAYYTERYMRSVVKKYGLTYRQMNYKHPSGQTWIVSRKV